MADFQRETAIRLFAREFRDSRVMIPGEGEKDPSYLITPTGGKVNRMHVVGVCTEVEPAGESGDMWRARISDPTGIFTVYAGQYQPEAAQVLSELQPPCFVAVTGKARTYEPEEGSIFQSIRPESVRTVDESTRDQWIVDTARRTKERLEAAAKVRADPSGVGPDDGPALAQTHYGLSGLNAYHEVATEALDGLVGGDIQVHEYTGPKEGFEAGSSGPATDAPAWTPPAPVTKEADPAEDALDEAVLAIVTSLQTDQGAEWDDITAKASDAGASSDDVEEALNRLMDKGLVYEPTLGVLKTT